MVTDFKIVFVLINLLNVAGKGLPVKVFYGTVKRQWPSTAFAKQMNGIGRCCKKTLAKYLFCQADEREDPV